MFANTKDVDYRPYNALTDMCDALCGPNKSLKVQFAMMSLTVSV